MPIRFSPLTGNIYEGKISKDGNCFTSKKDVTEEAVEAVFLHVLYHLAKGNDLIITCDGKRLRMTVEEAEEKPSAAAAGDTR